MKYRYFKSPFMRLWDEFSADWSWRHEPSHGFMWTKDMIRKCLKYSQCLVFGHKYKNLALIYATEVQARADKWVNAKFYLDQLLFKLDSERCDRCAEYRRIVK